MQYVGIGIDSIDDEQLIHQVLLYTLLCGDRRICRRRHHRRASLFSGDVAFV